MNIKCTNWQQKSTEAKNGLENNWTKTKENVSNPVNNKQNSELFSSKPNRRYFETHFYSVFLLFICFFDLFVCGVIPLFWSI